MNDVNHKLRVGCPTYVEAYPRLESREVSSAVSANSFAWSWDDGIHRVGDALVGPNSGSRSDIRIQSFFRRLRHVRLAPLDLSIKVVPETYKLYQKFFLFLCPLCQRRCRTIVYIRRWSCIRCTELYHVSELIKSEGTKWEYLQKLRHKTAGGLKKGGQKKTYLNLVAEMRDLERHFRRHPYVMPAPYAHRVIANLSGDDDPDWRDPTSWGTDNADDEDFY